MESKFCQSCGMPLTNEILGTNADGTPNEEYCIYCYKDGKFTQDMNMEQMIEHCAQFTDEINKGSGQNLSKEQMKEMLRKYLSQLNRWKQGNDLNLIKKAEKLLAECPTVTIASVNSDGFPRPVPMAKGDTEGCGVVWMATAADSVKVADFKRNPKAGLCYDKDGSSVCLRGMVEIIDDDKVRKEKWQDWYINHFPGGPTDPNYVLLRFVGMDATIWIDHEFAYVTL